MALMHTIKKKVFTSRIPYIQVLCVFLAFAFMVGASYLHGISIEKQHLEKDAKILSEYIEEQLIANLQELETMLGIVAETIRGMLIQGDSFEDVKMYITEMTDYGHRSNSMNGFVGIFAMFDCFCGAGINGNVPDLDWEKDIPDYIPQERPWYIAAQRSKGETVITDPYVDALQQEVAITYICSIYDNDGSRLAIICLDILLNNIYKFTSESQSFGIHAWMMLDNHLNIISFPYSEFLGMHVREAYGSGIEDIADKLEQGLPVSSQRFINPVGDIKIMSVRQIKNGWYIGVSTPVDSYYANLRNILWFLVFSGLFMASVLSVILIRIVSQKNKIENRTQLMLNLSPYGVNFLDKNYMIVDCNKAALKMFDMADKNKYKADFHNYSPEYQPNGKLSSEMKKLVLDAAYEEGAGRFEWTHKKPDGELLPVEVTIVRSTYEGEEISIAYMRDLREIKAVIAEKDKAIEENNMLKNLENIMNGLDIMIYVTEPSTGEILFINDSMKRHYNIEGNCVGELCYKLLQNNLDHKCDFCPCFKLDKEPDKAVVWEEHSTKTKRIYRNVDRFIPWPNNKTVHIQHSVDMTELIAAKDFAEQSSRYKSAFLANMSHEIRTPMNAILGIAEIQLQKKDIPVNFLDAFSKIYESGDLLLNIINDILDVSKVEAGKLELHPVNYDIPSLINDTVQLNRLRYDSKPIEFILQVDENTPHDLYGDELRIKQILNNILSNAFKYTNEGFVKFQISAEETQESDGKDIILIFQISDSGQGMSKDQINELFDEYTRFNLEANRSAVGAGLGMSITKRLVDIMNGSITVESEPDKGSLFTVHIPQKRAGDALCGPETAEKLQNFSSYGAAVSRKAQFLREYMPYGNVLVVDDVESNIYVIKGMLLPYGLNIEAVSNGFDAVEKIKNGKIYDIIFMDHMMPKMDGIEATKIMRKMGYTNIIIALTANAIIGREQMILQNGFDAYISKPIDSRDLNHFLNEFIRNRKPPEIVQAARNEQQIKGLISADINAKDMAKSQEMTELFIHDAVSAAEVLNALYGKIYTLNDEEMSLYITTVHGMKSALYNFGEKELSAKALKLEQAGEDRNLTVLSGSTNLFIDDLRSLIAKYKPDGGENVELSGEDKNSLREKLLEIKTACAAFDKKTAKDILNELKQKTWPPNIKNILDDIGMNILHSAFKKAITAIEDFLQSDG